MKAGWRIPVAIGSLLITLCFGHMALDTIFRATDYGYLGSPGWRKDIAQYVGATAFFGAMTAGCLLVRGRALRPVLAVAAFATALVVAIVLLLLATLPH